MDEYVKMGPLFYLQYFIGTLSVSLKTLQQNWCKMVYSLFWLAVYVFECLVYIQGVFNKGYIDNIDITGFVQGILGYLIVHYVLLNSLFDHKTQISAALNIQAAQDKLLLENIKPITLNKTYKLLFIFIILASVLNISGIASLLWFDVLKPLTFTSYFTIVHFKVLEFTSTAVFIIFEHKINCLHQSMNKATEKQICVRYSAERVNQNQRSALPRHVAAPGTFDTNIRQTLYLLREVRGTLCNNKSRIQKYFWPCVAWIFVKFSVDVPVQMTYVFGKNAELVNDNNVSMTQFFATIIWVSNAVYLFAHIHISEEGLRRNLEAVEEYNVLAEATNNDRVRREVKQQMLAELHRSQLTSCRVFDLEYSLVQEISDTSLMVFSTMNGN